MRKIVLHSPTVDRHGKFRDAGEELTVGAEDNEDTDIQSKRADALTKSGRAISASAVVETPVATEPAADRKAKG